ncbi:MAG: gliding motility-associated C-terminal domain-containing protein [Bacteroidetes bacterium]|nr:gliding motility-associated C-terminal domain-containing protein [Bacteroidota bacterium]
MRLVFPFGIMLLCCNILYCQDIFQFHLGGDDLDYGQSFYQTPDGNYLAVIEGYSFGFGDRDILITKLNTSGQILWSKVYGTTERDCIRNYVPDDNGNMIFISWTWTGQDDWTIFKIDQQGNLLNHITIGEGGDDELHFIEKIGTNQYILAGSSGSYHVSSMSDLYFASMDDNLNFNWFKSFGTTKKEYSRAVKYRSDGTLMAIATRFDSNNTNADICLINMTMDGEIIWAYDYNGGGEEVIWQILETSDGGFITSGYSNSGGAGDYDIHVTRYSDSGEFIWSKLYGGIGNDRGYDMKKTENDSYVIYSYSSSFNEGDLDLLLIEIGEQGELINSFLFGDIGDDYGGYITKAASDGWLLAGSTASYGLENNNGFFIITDENGLSCCSRSPDNIIITDLIMTRTPVNFSVGNDYSFKNISFNSADVDPDIKFICHNNLHITGPDSVCAFQQNVKYSISPTIDIGIEWLLPINWDITGNMNDTSILTNVTDTSGYIYLVNNFCSGDTIDSLFVNVFNIESPQLGNDTTICSNVAFVLDAGSSYNYFLWQDSTTSQYYSVIEPGFYWVEVQNEIGCVASDSIYIEMYPEFFIDLGHDTIVCNDEFVLLDPGFGFSSYLWQDGSSNQFLYANQTGSYWVEVVDENGCFAYDTINLQFVLPDPCIGSDTLICLGDSVKFCVTDEFESYLWQDGSSLPWFVCDESMLVWCQVTDTMGCVGSDSAFAELIYAPQVDLGSDVEICPGDTAIIASNIDDPGISLVWQDGSEDSIFVTSEPGIYWLQATNLCGSVTDSIEATQLALPEVFLGNDTILSSNSAITLDAGGGFTSYYWSNGSDQQWFIVEEAGTYWVEVSDGKCLNADTIVIEPIDCELFVPIVFSPNSDQHNDTFYADVSDDIHDFNLKVFNRWGEKVWETTDKLAQWDGKRNGQPSASSVYYWIVTYQCTGSPQTFERRGSVTLLR